MSIKRNLNRATSLRSTAPWELEQDTIGRRSSSDKRRFRRLCSYSFTRTMALLAIAALLVGCCTCNSALGFSHTLNLAKPAHENQEKAVLLDTTEQSSLDWVKYPDAGPQKRMPGWKEESFTNFDRGINWRSLVVCDVEFNSVNNWLWTPFVERENANRLYIEIKFTMRDCNLFPKNVKSCKETFALLYKEMDQPLGSPAPNSSFADSDSYKLIDVIAADEGRFTSNTDVVINTEIRSIPVSKRGVYFAFRDQGACLSLISIRVYHLSCPPLVSGLAKFNATPTGQDLTSLVTVEGECVPNAAESSNSVRGPDPPLLICTADGRWNNVAASGQCQCLAGFEPQANMTRCQACAPGRFKSFTGDSACLVCPDNSAAPAPGSAECRCLENYYRSHKDSPMSACSQPPSAPANLSAIYVDSTSLVLQWERPEYTGFRDDLAYRLVCDNCNEQTAAGSAMAGSAPQQTVVSSPPYYANFSETKCVLAGLAPSTSYRLRVYAMNGVSQLASVLNNQPVQYSEITVQTSRRTPQSTANTLSGQGGLQLLPIYNFLVLPGARPTEMLLAWDVQSLSSSLGQSLSSSAAAAAAAGTAATYSSTGALAGESASNGIDSLLDVPAVYEIRYQPRHLLESPTRRQLLYPASLIGGGAGGGGGLANNAGALLTDGAASQQAAASLQPQTISSTSRALLIGLLQPSTEYAFQIRTKWVHSSQWSEFSEPIYATTGALLPGASLTLYPDYAPNEILDLGAANGRPFFPGMFGHHGAAGQMGGPERNAGPQVAGNAAAGWSPASSPAFALLAVLGSLALAALALIHYKRNICARSMLGVAGFGQLGGGGSSTYGGVYGGGPASFGSPMSGHLQQGAAMCAPNSLIRGPNRSRGGRPSPVANVVQNFIVATLGQIGGGGNHHASSKQTMSSNMGDQQHTMAKGKQLFAAGAAFGQQPRNHYHQTLGAAAGVFHHTTAVHQNPLTGASDLFKYRTLCQQQQQQQGAALFGQHQALQDPQLHIYDDLDNTSSTVARQHQQPKSAKLEIEPHRVIIESVIGKGEFGDVCLAHLRPATAEGAELAAELAAAAAASARQVAVKTLKAHANDKAKLDFLIEASIMSQFDHPNIIRLEGVVTRSEPLMIVTELMENGSLDLYLRDNKNRFTCFHLISMLRGIAHGMQYLAKLNYIHKDLAARNILVNAEGVCKIADFGLSAHQSLAGAEQPAPPQPDYSNSDSSPASTNSSAAGSLSSGSGLGANLQLLADQLAQRRFAESQLQQLQQQQQPPPPPPPTAPNCQVHAIQNPKIPVRWTALESIAFRRFTTASDVWSFGVVCWEVMTEGERPYWNWSNQDVIKAVEQGYRLPQPEGCPELLYKMMLDCWLKDRLARPTFAQILKTLDRLLSPYDDPFCQQAPAQPQLVPLQSRLSSQEPAYYDAYNPVSQLIGSSSTSAASSGASRVSASLIGGGGGQQPQPTGHRSEPHQQMSVADWLGSIKMSRYAENFQRHQINSLQYVARLSAADLNLIGIQNSQHLKKILASLASLRSTASIGASDEGFLV